MQKSFDLWKQRIPCLPPHPRPPAQRFCQKHPWGRLLDSYAILSSAHPKNGLAWEGLPDFSR